MGTADGSIDACAALVRVQVFGLCSNCRCNTDADPSLLPALLSLLLRFDLFDQLLHVFVLFDQLPHVCQK